MITCKLYGRLGNQMFQIATTIATALRYNTFFSIPRQTIDPGKWPSHPFDFKEKISPDQINEFYFENGHQYQDIPYHNNILCLDGYFQSEKYFKDYAGSIRKYFQSPKLNKYNGNIGIHVRRGDFLLYPDKHPILPYSYYESAINSIKNITGKVYRYYIFSDDIEYCKKMFNHPGMDFCHSGDPLTDMFEMANCEHNIIANSSFSWWSAWLNPNPNKIVIAPTYKKYFGPGNAHLDTKDLIPESWTQIDY